MATIDLSRPKRSERVRGFQPPWRTVNIYECSECHKETRIYASSCPSVGGVYCRHCTPIEKVKS